MISSDNDFNNMRIANTPEWALSKLSKGDDIVKDDVLKIYENNTLINNENGESNSYPVENTYINNLQCNNEVDNVNIPGKHLTYDKHT